jgi:RNA polymerase sigma factor (sigma-70 family)
LVHYGKLCERLDRQEAAAADCERRINSIGQLLVKEVVAFYRSLSPEGRSSYDPEDLLLECWAELKKRNDKYDPDRGNYRTFAARIIRNTFLGVLERTRCVRLPANSAGLFRDIDQASRMDAERLVNTAKDHADLGSLLVQDLQPSPIDALIEMEERDELLGEVAEAMEEMTVLECLVLRVSSEKRTIADAAEEYGYAPRTLRIALNSAKVKLKLRREREPD